jgi:hypothetical protein
MNRQVISWFQGSCRSPLLWNLVHKTGQECVLSSLSRYGDEACLRSNTTTQGHKYFYFSGFPYTCEKRCNRALSEIRKISRSLVLLMLWLRTTNPRSQAVKVIHEDFHHQVLWCAPALGCHTNSKSSFVYCSTEVDILRYGSLLVTVYTRSQCHRHSHNSPPTAGKCWLLLATALITFA